MSWKVLKRVLFLVVLAFVCLLQSGCGTYLSSGIGINSVYKNAYERTSSPENIYNPNNSK